MTYIVSPGSVPGQSDVREELYYSSGFTSYGRAGLASSYLWDPVGLLTVLSNNCMHLRGLIAA